MVKKLIKSKVNYLERFPLKRNMLFSKREGGVMGISVVQLAKLNVGGGGATANLDQNEANMYSL